MDTLQREREGRHVRCLKLSEDLWARALDAPLYFSREDAMVSFALTISGGHRLPERGFGVAVGTEVFLVISGTLILGLEDGEHEIEPGTVSILAKGEKHYARNPGEDPVMLVQATGPAR
jgi:hypothetical protein